MVTLADIAKVVGGQCLGNENLVIDGFAGLDNIQTGKIAFVNSEKLLAKVEANPPSALITKDAWRPSVDIPLVIVDDPYLAYAKASQLFSRKPKPNRQIHASAVIAESVSLGANVSIGPGAVIEDDVQLADGVMVGPNTVIGQYSRVGRNTRLAANVTLCHDVQIGEDCELGSGTVIGSDGFGFAPSREGWSPIAQNGGVIIGNCVKIGANNAIDCGAIGPTRIADGVIIDNLVHIAHNVEIGENTAIAGCVGIAGSTKIGKNCLFAGQVGINGHIEICDNVQIGGQSRVTKSIKEAGAYASGTPLMENKLWRRAAVNFSRSVTKKS